ncbi:hypothetical protein [Bradyrhizobium japonicum]|uniref:hypothetical protein n=1 Tax=Bradyrhizobium japonicum TaxID=375 RepID=UPI001E6464A1|nr:hypothetical protein [Bradyrhizobium japonicum]MCD9821225.1 hypothetical protein [Bradyrhizobium japonicum]MEB2674079.1 hypothetical protein [Bradyrhizobium japonicum]WRI93265.1 hypothetical protein R3F75_20970 [Bradyrhizobium japonicum]
MQRDDRIVMVTRVCELALQGEGPEVQGAVLVDLVSMYFAGHHPAMREEMIEFFIRGVRSLIGVNEQILFERHGGMPEGWSKQ